MRRPRIYTTDALILKRMDYGEADRILTLFTPGRGKIKAIAKGARRTTSRIAGHVELFTRSQLQLAAGRDLEIITQGESQERFPHLRAGLWHATTAYYLAELIDKFTEEHNEYADLYTLLIESLRRLDEDAASARHASNGHNGAHALHETPAIYAALSGDIGAAGQGNGYATGNGHPDAPYRSRAWQMLRYFEVHLLGDLGYRPSLHECAACGSTLQPVENGFNPTLGGVLCPNCSRYSQRPISLPSLKVLRLLQTSPWESIPRLRLDSSQQSEIEYLLQALIRFHLERDLKSWDFLRHIQPAY
ncbi:MAG TPA: DNA repair protein RecO [Ktedonobacterales bacterium]|jgi:DNA repair protein RecO (recombination protein O)